MFYIIIIILIFFLLFSKLKDTRIDFKSFFRKGFKISKDKFGLFCFTGKQGSGKTYSSVRFLLENAKNGFIITNVKSFAKSLDYLYIDNILDIIDFAKNYNGDKQLYIFFDEIFTILEKKTAINKDILSFISQLRKRHIILITTAQEWSEINITFRRYVRFQISCNMFRFPFLHTAIIINSIHDGDTLKWNGDTMEYEAQLIQKNIHKANLWIADSYDTYETINTDNKV